ncbi:MAG: M24 family metallopeptidase [Mesorhizobium sp.]|uniref:M24 family metallopeptidase n=1 Tax=unclassified Mesorhizobium TaxID=325217 RepID=UPI000FE4AD8B|nr:MULTISPECIES: Xaa-Pro peptidase family protein [unclassified Mesorhizobium]RWC00142.1 MAG: M24 family metallopeptidase [Mesorhizobium sp.]RWG59014.1 MAG: M24 family metallopeptidase [Mesorhizobium sp.]RWH47352.1 MAG: M24 family metallopeptidase [Mesorhizobium sp.]RWH79765.1 MAG: M24 family metallopeptidase [Mesorhizobium sp.]RWH82428.1 MAG: M24 family metallopeptidase [Mesorhizobium sp.]
METILHFERAEYAARLAAVKAEMSKRGLEILLISEPPNQNYLTGYDAYSFYTPQMAIVALDREEPIIITRGMDMTSARITTYLSEDSIRGFPDNYVNSIERSAYDYVASVVQELGGEKAVIGVEMGGYYYSARAHADLVKALPQARFEDADLLVNWIRLVKSSAELEFMRQAGLIGDAVIKRVIETAEPGVRECDLAAAAYHQEISGTPEFGGTYNSSVVHLCVGERALAPHSTWTDRPLSDTTIINFEVHGTRRRYQVNVSRTIHLGKPSADYVKLADIAIEALNAGLESVRPGQTCSDVFAAFHAVLSRNGLEKDQRIGYPLGIGYPPTVAERTASIRKEEKTVLQAGMCFHMMTGLWLGVQSVTITQPFAVTEEGYEPLTHTPRTLVVK